MNAESTPGNIKDPNSRLLRERVVEAMERFHVPGVAVGIFHEGKEQIACFGVTHVDHPLPVDADTLFQIGSVTKTATGTAVMRLVEQGKLDLDTPIRAYLPNLQLASKEVAARVAMRHLLTHTGGWVGDYFDDLGPGDDALAKYVANMADLPQLTPLGEIWSYNNSGFVLAGLVVQTVTGQAFEAAIQELVLDPLGMSTSFFFARDVITHRYVVGHNVDEEKGAVVTRPWAIGRAAHPAGGIISTVKDQLRYARFHLGDGAAEDGARLLTPESMALMQSPLAPAGNMADAVGITWMLRDVAGACTVVHNGRTNGQVSIFTLAPERDFAIIILTNSERGGALNSEVVKWALGHYLGFDEPEPVPLELSEKELAPFVGRYSSVLADVEASPRGGGLVLRTTPKGGFPCKDSPPPPAPPPMPVVFYADDRVVATEGLMKGARGEFLRDPDGSIAWLRVGGRIHKRETTLITSGEIYEDERLHPSAN